MDIRHHLRPFTAKDNRLAALNLAATATVYLAATALAVSAARGGAWVWAGLGVLLLGFAGARLFVLQHDLGHLALFESKRQNELWGYLVSPFTMAPFAQLRHSHNLHHAYVGDLDARETAEVYTMTLAEWERAGPLTRLVYRLYRNPAILIPLGALYTYAITYRWPRGTLRVGVVSLLAHNLAVAAWFGLIWVWAGWSGVLALAAATWLSGMIGVALVYLQHNFPGTWWDHRPELDFERASLQGGSCLDFGWVFDELVANITKHDIHHLVASVPCYRLRAARRALEQTHGLRRIGWREALSSFRLKLWDEDAGDLVPFPRAARAALAVPRRFEAP